MNSFRFIVQNHPPIQRYINYAVGRASSGKVKHRTHVGLLLQSNEGGYDRLGLRKGNKTSREFK